MVSLDLAQQFCVLCPYPSPGHLFCYPAPELCPSKQGLVYKGLPYMLWASLAKNQAKERTSDAQPVG